MSGNSLFPLDNSPQRLNDSSAKPRAKVALKPGRSLMDWIRLGKSGKDLTSVGGNLQLVTLQQLAQHNKKDDAWTAIRGKVYNITPYMEYHPGGEDELMRGAGIDGTTLFDSIHKWVNAESMLEKCLIGNLENTPVISLVRKKLEASASPRYEWDQDDESIIITVKTGWTYIHPDHVTIDKTSDKNIRISVRTEKHTFLIHLALLHEITMEFKVYAEPPNGLVNIILEKRQHGIKWKLLGKPLAGDNSYMLSWRAESIWRTCNVRKVVALNYNTKIFRILIPDGSRVPVPVGHHLQIKQKIEGVDLARNYTTVLPSMLPERQDPDVAEGKAVYLIIKIYPDGAMTPYIGRLKKGDKVTMCDSMGQFSLSRLEGVTHLICLAAGTGITPFIRLVYHALHERPLDNPRKVHLVFYNKTLADIFWMDQFDDLAEKNSRFEVTHVLTEEPEYRGMTGRINKEHINQLINIKQIKEFVPNPSNERLDVNKSEESSTSTTAQKISSETDFCRPLICVCGTLGFVNTTKILLQQHGIKDEFIYIFEGS